MAELTLQLGALSGLASDDASAFPVLTAVSSSSPFAHLCAGSGVAVRLAPGGYLVEILARPIEGAFSPELVLSVAGAGDRRVMATETSAGVYRFAFVLDRALQSMRVEFRDAVKFIFVRARMVAEEELSAAPPTVRDALLNLARATFSKTPHMLRKRLLAPGRRAKWLQRVRKSVTPVATSAGSGRVLNDTSNGDCEALRFDFENRLAVARGAPLAQNKTNESLSSPRAMAIAFYLPQFHPIPENDAWWGAGFTEWTNVTKAIPQFVGHYQPRLPGELGFYDLRTPGIMAKQAELARMHGVSAFCIHHYWFNGRPLLESPLESFLGDRSIDIAFCLCWANENWTRRWDGDESEVLIAQNHSPKNHARLFADFARAMDDPRYVRVDGKPVLVVYRPDIIEDARAMTDIWRDEAQRRGWPGLYLIATNAFGFFDALALGFDGLAEFPPHGLQARSVEGELSWLNRRHEGRVFSYEDVAREESNRLRSIRAVRGEVRFPGVMPSWDNEARRPGAGITYHGATPEAYGAWLAAAVDYAERVLPPDRRFVFINAWNEWAEGAYLEPDRAHGRVFLTETAHRLSSR